MSFTLFRRFPIELRHRIYTAHFSTLTQTYPAIRPPPILLASRQLHDEALPSYWRTNHFAFPGTKHLVDFLTSIPDSTLRSLRHVSVCAYPFPVYPVDAPGGYITYLFDRVLSLFPGLQLSRLWVGDPYAVALEPWGHDVAYAMVEMLSRGDAWRELVYVVEHDRFMKSCPLTSIDLATNVRTVEWSPRDPQPSTWDAMIKARDGVDSGAGVEMCRLFDGGKRRVPLTTEFETVQRLEEGFVTMPDDGQIEITVRRGRNADVVEKGVTDCEKTEGLRALFKEIGWKGIQAKGLYLDGEDDPTAHL
ncbi:MAG: hypothetical protein Q9197_001539 [Variospora fuerteventurae]